MREVVRKNKKRGIDETILAVGGIKLPEVGNNGKVKTARGYVLLGIATDEAENYYPVRVVVNQYSTVEEVEVLDVLYAANAKKKNQSSNQAELPADAVPPIKGSSVIRISNLLELVKNDFSDVMTDDVVEKLGVTRRKITLAESLKYTGNLLPAGKTEAFRNLKEEGEKWKLPKDRNRL